MIGLSLIRQIGHLESKDHRRLKDRWRRSALNYSQRRNNNRVQGDQLTRLQVKEKWMEVMLTWTVMTKMFQKIKKPTHLSNLVTFNVMMHNIIATCGTLRPLVLFIITINLIVASLRVLLLGNNNNNILMLPFLLCYVLCILLCGLRAFLSI